MIKISIRIDNSGITSGVMHSDYMLSLLKGSDLQTNKWVATLDKAKFIFPSYHFEAAILDYRKFINEFILRFHKLGLSELDKNFLQPIICKYIYSLFSSTLIGHIN